jgi:hypothetical protein
MKFSVRTALVAVTLVAAWFGGMQARRYQDKRTINRLTREIGVLRSAIDVYRGRENKMWLRMASLEDLRRKHPEWRPPEHDESHLYTSPGNPLGTKFAEGE